MPQAIIRFYAELNDFLPENQRHTDFQVLFDYRASVKHLIESIGVPHTEVDLILVNGESVDFSFQLKDLDQISVYPVFESFDISPIIKLRPEPLRQIRFILDTHLGKLAAYLRLLGFDTEYNNKMEDAELAKRSREEKRILLTRDKGLLKRSTVTHGYYVRCVQPKHQVKEVLKYFDLNSKVKPFSRCMECNQLLLPIEKKEILNRLKPDTRRYYDVFHVCIKCDRIFWEGSHVQRMKKFMQDILD